MCIYAHCSNQVGSLLLANKSGKVQNRVKSGRSAIFRSAKMRAKSSWRNHTSEFCTSHVHILYTCVQVILTPRLPRDRKPWSHSQLLLVHPKDFACTTDRTESYTLFPPPPTLLCAFALYHRCNDWRQSKLCKFATFELAMSRLYVCP